MSDWTPCEDCKSRCETWMLSRISPYEGYQWGRFDHLNYPVCEDCRQTRMSKLGPILMDRGYRAHLARRVLGISCPTQCPEHPSEHATLDFFECNEFGYAYMDLIDFALDQFKRPWNAHYVTAFEALAGENEVEAIHYCPHCLSKAEDNLALNTLIRLCGPCLEMRNNHIAQTFQHLQRFHEPWEKFDETQVFVPEILEGHAKLGYDELVKNRVIFFEKTYGSAVEWAKFAATVAVALPLAIFKIYFDYQAKWDRDRVFNEQVRQNNRNYDEMVRQNNRTFNETVRQGDRTHNESVRQSDRTFNESVRQSDRTHNESARQSDRTFNETVRQNNRTYDQSVRENNPPAAPNDRTSVEAVAPGIPTQQRNYRTHRARTIQNDPCGDEDAAQSGDEQDDNTDDSEWSEAGVRQPTSPRLLEPRSKAASAFRRLQTEDLFETHKKEIEWIDTVAQLQKDGTWLPEASAFLKTLIDTLDPEKKGNKTSPQVEDDLMNMANELRRTSKGSVEVLSLIANRIVRSKTEHPRIFDEMPKMLNEVTKISEGNIEETNRALLNVKDEQDVDGQVDVEPDQQMEEKLIRAIEKVTNEYDGGQSNDSSTQETASKQAVLQLEQQFIEKLDKRLKKTSDEYSESSASGVNPREETSRLAALQLAQNPEQERERSMFNDLKNRDRGEAFRTCSVRNWKNETRASEDIELGLRKI